MKEWQKHEQKVGNYDGCPEYVMVKECYLRAVIIKKKTPTL